MNTQQILEQVLEPIRIPVRARAIQEATKRIQWFQDRLAEHDFDMRSAFPYPRSGRVGKEEYHRMITQLNCCRTLVETDESRYEHPTMGTLKQGQPHYVKLSETYCEKFINECVAIAEQQYTAFISKMCTKVGVIISATLVGEHVWDHSILTVVTESGETQHWKTQMIVNVSKLGTLFNQWPTRKIK